MKTNWNYTKLARAYVQRPSYSNCAIDKMVKLSGLKDGAPVCDIGAGVAHLTLMLLDRGLDVTAIEPNSAMRKFGIKRTTGYQNISWLEGTGEKTNLNDNSFQMVTFGSSFNVCNREQALIETARILKTGGWFACMWNHRQLNDPIQRNIENIIKETCPSYKYGIRREDQSSMIESSGLFQNVEHFKNEVIHQQTIDQCITAWKSHATLQRQAGSDFDKVITNIECFLLEQVNSSEHSEFTLNIPYHTNIWLAQLK